jgi:hypothetical protein
MTATRRILPEFVSWLETAYGDAERGAGSEFAVEPPPETMAIAEVALEAALKAERPVLLASSVSLKSIVGALIFRRARVRLEQVFAGDLTDDQFGALVDALRTLKNSSLVVESPPTQSGFPGDNLLRPFEQAYGAHQVS